MVLASLHLIGSSVGSALGKMANGTGEGSKIIKRRTKHSQSSEPPAKQPRSSYVSQNVNQTKPVSNEWHSNAGMITRVLMKNFMCHGELDYRPKERLNFLHGANGSGCLVGLAGKSAGMKGTRYRHVS